jgi:hypothetical protein
MSTGIDVDPVIRDFSNPSGNPITHIESLAQSHFDSRLKDGKWTTHD